MYILQLNMNGNFCCYLAGKKKSYSKFRKFDVLETSHAAKALQFETELEAIAYRQASPLTLNYFPVDLQTDTDDNPDLCGGCSGSGLGGWNGGSCKYCNGTGIRKSI